MLAYSIKLPEVLVFAASPTEERAAGVTLCKGITGVGIKFFVFGGLLHCVFAVFCYFVGLGANHLASTLLICGLDSSSVADWFVCTLILANDVYASSCWRVQGLSLIHI